MLSLGGEEDSTTMCIMIYFLKMKQIIKYSSEINLGSRYVGIGSFFSVL